MHETIRDLVRQRAQHVCEYCTLREQDQPAFRFHIEHIRPRKHGGTDDPTNLALACRHCNLHKGSNLSGVDPETGTVFLLFHPRTDTWSDHFAFSGRLIVGLTPVGRATVAALQMNHPKRLRLRRQLGTSSSFE